MKVTLDTNCIIDLEENRNSAPSLRELIFLHDTQIINLCVGAISASERKPDGTYSTNFNEFKQKIANAGLGHVDILLPIAYPGMAFVGWCYPGEATTLEKKIQEILFPNAEYDYLKYCNRKGIDPTSEIINRDWRNKRCDVLALLSHISSNRDIFVTSDDDDMLSKKERLIDIGAGDILKPRDAVLAIQKQRTKLS